MKAPTVVFEMVPDLKDRAVCPHHSRNDLRDCAIDIARAVAFLNQRPAVCAPFTLQFTSIKPG